jgi:TetR/AcrR family transcriptional repressor of nem operon
MGRPSLADARDTRTEILKLTQQLIQTHGYNGFSYQDISDELGIRKASIHYHFPSKEDAVLSLLDLYCDKFIAWTKRAEQEYQNASDLLQAYFEFFAKLSDNHSRICAGGALAAEWNALPGSIKKKALALIDLHRGWLKRVIKSGRGSGEFSSEGSADQQAQFIFSAIQGGLQVSRVEKDASWYRAVTGRIKAVLLSR